MLPDIAWRSGAIARNLAKIRATFGTFFCLDAGVGVPIDVSGEVTVQFYQTLLAAKRTCAREHDLIFPER
ncbi:MAG: hypothetical protein M3Y65_08125 [Pseudomonadota bacterium]|nr:hypothetical protein [Pseudomonadota bacterium]